MAKQLIACCQTEVLDDEGTDCGTLRGVPFTITEKNKNKVIHRYIMVNKKPLLLTEDNINTFVGKTVNLRSPMTCIGNKICNCCAGEFDYKMGSNMIGLKSSRVATTLTNLGGRKFSPNKTSLIAGTSLVDNQQRSSY